MSRLAAELRRLRWKLALAYTVTTASVLTVLFVLLAAVASNAGSTRAQQGRYVSNVLRQVAARAAPLLAAEPVDSARLSVLLTLALERSGIDTSIPQVSFDLASEDEAAPLDLRLGERAAIVALDRRGLLVASTLLDAGPAIGQRFDTASMPGLDALLAGDLARQNVSIDEVSGQAVIVAPITGSQRLGTLICTVSGLPSWPNELGALLSSLGGLITAFTGSAALVGLVFGLITAHGLTRRLRTIERVTARWGGGDFSARLDDRAADEIGQLSRQLNGVADQLQALIRERQQFATLDERNRLARDLHDSVKQHVFAISMSLGAAQELWAEDAVAAAALTGSAATATAYAQRELSDIIRALRPAELERAGLAQAISDFAAQWSAQTGIAATAQTDRSLALPHAAEHALFRIAQEALANVARHSGARAVALSLRAEQGAATLRVRDDGRGFDPTRARAGIGLSSMRERAAAIGATLTLTSAGQGTEIIVALPAQRAEPNEQL